jgi:hypothetical protein
MRTLDPLVETIGDGDGLWTFVLPARDFACAQVMTGAFAFAFAFACRSGGAMRASNS